MKINRFLKSFKDAFVGLKMVFKNERNFRVQVGVACLVFLAMAIFPLSNTEKLLTVAIIFAVLVMEIINTAIEIFLDLLKPRLHHYVKNVKDIMAGAVFLTSLCALIVGLMIYLPHLIKLFR